MQNKNINFRTSPGTVKRLQNMVESGEARNLSDAVNKILDRYFQIKMVEVSP